MNDHDDDRFDANMPEELRALRAVERTRELTPDEQRRYAELVHARLLELTSAIDLAAAPITAEVDQMAEGVRHLTQRIEALGEQRGTALADAAPDATKQLACALLRAAALTVVYGKFNWDPPELEAVRRELTEVDERLTWAEEECAESIAELEAWEAEGEEGPKRAPAGPRGGA